MSLRHALISPLCALAVGGVLVVPAVASAEAGGAASGSTPPTAPGGATGGAGPTGAPPSSSPPGGGVSLAAPSAAFVGQRVSFRGSSAARSGRAVVLQKLSPSDAWVSVARGTVSAAGTFAITWSTRRAGRLRLRAVLAGPASPARAAGASPVVRVAVYAPARATYYGPGFYGQKTACGTRLGRTTLGVANRTLPCGTRVALRFRGRSITVRVIDRGPFANGADWDLTAATADALRMTGTSRIGVLAPGP